MTLPYLCSGTVLITLAIAGCAMPIKVPEIPLLDSKEFVPAARAAEPEHPVRIVEVRFCQSEQLLLQRDRFFDELPSVHRLWIATLVAQVSAKAIPKTE